MRDLKTPVLFFAALLFFSAFNAYIPITDPVESNYALTAKEMYMNSNWLSPQIYGNYWFDKPIMIYWLLCLSFKLFGITDFAARFPEAVFSAASISLLFWFGQKIFTRRIAVVSALILATSLEYWILSRMVITDSVLFFFNSAALSCLYLGMDGRGSKYFLLFYAASGFALLTKGPVGFLIPLLIFSVYVMIHRRYDLILKVKPIIGMVVLLLVAGPWYLYMIQTHGSDFVDTFLGLHNYLRATVSEHPKDNVFYYYLILFPVSMLPWTGVLFGALYHAIRRRKNFVFGYLVVWCLVILLFYSLMATKYPTYVFPAMFPAAILIAWYIDQLQYKSNKITWFMFSGMAVVFFLLSGTLEYWVLHKMHYLLPSIAVLIAFLVMFFHYKGYKRMLPVVIGCSSIILSLMIIQTVLLPLSINRSAKEISQNLPLKEVQVASFGDYSTSAVYYSGLVLPRLVESQQDSSAKGVWAGKYTMSSEEIQHFNLRTKNDLNTYILIMGKENEFYRQGISSEFEKIANRGDYTLLKRK